MIGVAVFLAFAALASTWLYQNVVTVVARLHATRDVPEPAGNWLLGHIPLLLAKPLSSFRCFHAWAKQHGPIYRVRFLWRPVLVVTDPELYQPLLRSGPMKLQKYTPPYRMFEVFVKPPRSNLISSGETPTWKVVRRAAVTALTMNNMRVAFPHITAVTQRLIDSLAAAGPHTVADMDAAAQQVTIDIIGLAAFDRDLRATCTSNTQSSADDNSAGQQAGTAAESLSSWGGGSSGAGGTGAAGGGVGGIVGRGGEVLVVMRHLVVAMQSRNNPLNRWFPWRKAYRDLMYWGGVMSSLVQDLTADLQAHPPPDHTLAAQLMACRQPNGEPLDRIQLMTELGLMWGAGFETTAHTICWTLFLVASHPHVEAAVVGELASLGLLATRDNPQPGHMKWEHLAQLRYLSAVLNESMRLFPVVSSGTIRVTHKPIQLGPYRVPAGQPILIPFYSIHRSPALWEDPDSFKPGRWLDEEAAAAAAAAAAGSRQQPSTAAAAPAGEEGGDGDGDVAAAAVSQQAASVASSEDDDYVDVAADILASRDQQKQQQQQQQQQQQHKEAVGGAGDVSQQQASGLPPLSSSKASSSGLELKDPSVTRRGFLPFSEGSRNCVGQALALVELKAVLAMLLGNFSFELAPEMGGYAGVEADARQAITLRPEHGLMVYAKHRSLA